MKNFNERALEVAIIGSYRSGSRNITFGDVVYLDRGRAMDLRLEMSLRFFPGLTEEQKKEFLKTPLTSLVK